MTFPDEVHTAILVILRTAIAEARNRSYPHTCRDASTILSHVHTLPGVLLSDNIVALRAYMTVEVPSFHASLGEKLSGIFSDEWQVLRDYLSTEQQ